MTNNQNLPANATTTKEVAILQKNITDSVLKEIKVLETENNIQFPSDYSYVNALKSAWLILQETEDRNKQAALSVCTNESIVNSLLDMIIQGLSPAKKQCYFIVFGKKLTLMRSYFGSVAVAKRVSGLKDINAEVIRDGQEFTFDVEPDTGIKRLVKHQMPFDTLNNKITGAYAIKELKDGSRKMEIMTREDIQKAWEQGATKGKSPAHLNFEGEMCKKTVLNRACKIEINASSDSDIVVAAVNRTTESEYSSLKDEMAVRAEYETSEETEELKTRILNNKLPDPKAANEAKKQPEKPKKEKPPTSIAFEEMKAFIMKGQIEPVKKRMPEYNFSEVEVAELNRLIAHAERVKFVFKWAYDLNQTVGQMTGREEELANITTSDDLMMMDSGEVEEIYNSVKSLVE